MEEIAKHHAQELAQLHHHGHHHHHHGHHTVHLGLHFGHHHAHGNANNNGQQQQQGGPPSPEVHESYRQIDSEAPPSPLTPDSTDPPHVPKVFTITVL